MIRRPPRSTHCISSAASDVYKRQAKFICESALCLVKSDGYLENTNKGGVLTTATGLGDHLIKRLKNAEILFEGPEKIAKTIT